MEQKLICQYCGEKFKAANWEVKRGRKFCSKECSNKGRYSRNIVECEICGKLFSVRRGANQRFCSVKCRGTGMKGKNHGSYKGGTAVRTFHNGLQYRAVRGERTNGGGEMFEHRKIAAKALGRSLTKKEVVHHINCNSLDNRNCNLLICDPSYHHWLHQEMSRKYARLFLDL